jgi:hypothetical protein
MLSSCHYAHGMTTVDGRFGRKCEFSRLPHYGHPPILR